MNNNFRISAKRLLLTYNRIEHDIDALVEQILKKVHLNNVLCYAAVLEPSVHGYIHLHFYIKTEKKIYTRNPDFLTIELDNYKYKPLYKRVKDIPSSNISLNSELYENFFDLECNEENVLEYILKFIHSKSDPRYQYRLSPNLQRRLTSSGSILSKERAAINLAKHGDIPSALLAVQEIDSKTLLLNYRQIKSNLVALSEERCRYLLIIPAWDTKKEKLPASLSTAITCILNVIAEGVSSVTLLYPKTTIYGCKQIVAAFLYHYNLLYKITPKILLCDVYTDLQDYTDHNLIIFRETHSWRFANYLSTSNLINSQSTKSLPVTTDIRVDIPGNVFFILYSDYEPTNLIGYKDYTFSY